MLLHVTRHAATGEKPMTNATLVRFAVNVHQSMRFQTNTTRVTLPTRVAIVRFLLVMNRLTVHFQITLVQKTFPTSFAYVRLCVVRMGVADFFNRSF